MVWLERLELPESVVPKVPLVLTEFPVRKERKVILELLVPLDSPVLVVFKEKSEIPVQWVLRVLRLNDSLILMPIVTCPITDECF